MWLSVTIRLYLGAGRGRTAAVLPVRSGLGIRHGSRAAGVTVGMPPALRVAFCGERLSRRGRLLVRCAVRPGIGLDSGDL